MPKPMLRERGDNDRQAIAHHKGGQTRSPSGHDLKTRSRPRLTDERPFGVGRPFGELENDRGLTREIVPAYHDGSCLQPARETRKQEFRSGQRVMELAYFYPK